MSSSMLLSPPKDIRFSGYQQRLVLLAKLRVQNTFLAVNVLLVLLVAYTAHRYPNKYLRVVGECDSNWLHRDATADAYEVICCPPPHGFSHAPCYAGMDLSPVLASTQGAWVLPLTPLIFNYVAMILGPNASLPRVRVRTRRALLYIALMAIRTFVLYAGLNRVEHGITTLLFGARNESACWYAPLRRSKSCAERFDHSDHLVLLVGHYLAICMFEWFALTVESPMRTAKKTLLQCWIVIVAAAATYTLFYTMSFFHTAMENVVALAIAQCAIMLPLYLLSQDKLGSTVSQLQLKYFVEPPEDPNQRR